MLTLAMQLHDQYVEKGKNKAKEITEASQNKYNDLVTKANNYSERTRSEADDYSTRTRSDADTYSDRTRSEPTLTVTRLTRMPRPTPRTPVLSRRILRQDSSGCGQLLQVSAR